MSFFGKYYFASTKHLASECEEPSLQEWASMASSVGIPNAWSPPTDMYETADGVTVLMDVAGCRPQDLRLQVESDVLIVRGVRCDRQPPQKRTYLLMEIHHGPFERHIPLPRPVQPAAGHAVFRHGMLEIFIPFRQETAIAAAVVMLRIEWLSEERDS